MYLPGTDTLRRVLRITDKDMRALRRGWTTARATAIPAVAALPIEQWREFITSREGLLLLGPALVAAAEKRKRESAYEQTGYAEPYSSEAEHKEALYTPTPEAGAAESAEGGET